MAKTGPVRSTPSPASLDVMVMRIVTRFTNVDDFVGAFRRFCTDNSCFIPSAHAKRVGVETGFSIRLADGTPMLRGLCVVLDSWSTDDNPYKRPGVRLGIRSLTAESKPIFQRLQLARLAPLTPPMATRILVPDDDDPTRPMPVVAEVLPANPLSDMNDDAVKAFIDCTMFEDADDAVPEPIDATSTEPNQGETQPMPSPVPTLLGVCPIALPLVAPDDSITMPMPVAMPIAPPPVPRARIAMVALSTQLAPAMPWWKRLVRSLRALFRPRTRAT